MLQTIIYFALFGFAVGDFNVLLLHTNDMHARFQQADRYLGLCANDSDTNCYGGFARIRSTVDELRKTAADKGRPTIFLNAGDTYQGTPYYTFFKWPIVAKFINMLGLEVMSLGNHEFDDGIAGLAPYIKNVTVPIVCSNLNISLEPALDQPNLMSSKVLDVNGTKIGVIGYLTPDTMFLSNTEKVQVLDEIPRIRAEAQRLLTQNVQILIALGHSGYTKDQQIAQEVAEIDVVVGGHSHTFLYSGTPLPDVEVPEGPYPTVITQPSGKKVPVVQAYYGTKYLGYLELDFDDNGDLKSFTGSPILLRGNLTQDETILEALKPYENNISVVIDHIVGYTSVLLDNNANKCKLGECNIGNLITDSYVDYVVRHYDCLEGWTIAAIGIAQAGGIRASIDTQSNSYHNGSITLGDVITAVPWGAKVVVLNITGEVLRKALEFSVNRYEATVTGHVSEFLQVSGLKVVYDMARPSGSRVVSVTALCSTCDVPIYKPLEANSTYGVVLPDYIAHGGDGFTMFANITGLFLGDVDYDVLADYIETHTPVNPVIEGRITILNAKSSAFLAKLNPSLVMVALIFVMISKLYF